MRFRQDGSWVVFVYIVFLLAVAGGFWWLMRTIDAPDPENVYDPEGKHSKAEILAQYVSEQDFAKTETVVSDGLGIVLPPPQNSYAVDFAKPAALEMMETWKRTADVLVTRPTLLRAYAFEPRDAFSNEACSNTGFRGRRVCRTHWVVPSVARFCYFAQENLPMALPRVDAGGRHRIGNMLIRALAGFPFEEGRAQDMTGLQSASYPEMMEEGSHWAAYVYRDKDGGKLAEKSPLLHGRIYLNGKLFSLSCQDADIHKSGAKESLLKWETATVVPWLKAVAAANSE